MAWMQFNGLRMGCFQLKVFIPSKWACRQYCGHHNTPQKLITGEFLEWNWCWMDRKRTLRVPSDINHVKGFSAVLQAGAQLKCHSIAANICCFLLVLFLINVFAYQPRTAVYFCEKKCGKKTSSKQHFIGGRFPYSMSSAKIFLFDFLFWKEDTF